MSASKSKKPARLERRVRVTFFLVAETEGQRNAVLELISYLEEQYVYLSSYGESELPVTGFTHSAIHSSTIHRKGRIHSKMFEKGIFWGHWWTEDEDDIGQISLMPIIERVVFFLIDFPAVAEEWKTDENINFLKTKIFQTYEKWGSPQEEIWIVKQDIYRYA
ncbi:MAG: hypothetical protein Q7S77_01190 [Candidatus Staskawiczbacteria bacterium]|nr:hypothetical protein [Candidatus Staskawiczbacteria bacterium]